MQLVELYENYKWGLIVIMCLKRPQVREALGRILNSSGFHRSRRLATLLQYLVDESVAGRADRIKATTIAIDVFGRDQNFDQQSDPIVRVEAGRLRQRLADYYHAAGASDPLSIEVPKGGYRPVFKWRGREAASPVPHSPSLEHPTQRLSKQPGRANPLLPVVGLMALMLVATWVLLFYLFSERDVTSPAAITPAEGRPYVVVMPVVAMTNDQRTERLAAGLVEALITNLSKLSGLSVMAHASVLEAQHRAEAYNLQDFRGEFGVSHLVRSTLESDGNELVLYVQLVDARNAKVLWAERMSRDFGRRYELQEALALAIATNLAVRLQPGESERLAQSHGASAEAWLFYRQGLITIMPPRDLARLEAARMLFDRARELAPEFPGADAGYSFAHATRALFMNTAEPQRELARAVEYAESAVALDPEFGTGHAMLALAQVLGGRWEAGLESVELALKIQPGDAFSRFVLGMSLVLAGEPSTAIPHLQEARRLDPLEPRVPYLNVSGIASYGAGDYAGALATFEQNESREGPRGPHIDVFIAAALAQLGEEARARQVIVRLGDRYPEFPVRAWLARWLANAEHLRQTESLLLALGLESAEG